MPKKEIERICGCGTIKDAINRAEELALSIMKDHSGDEGRSCVLWLVQVVAALQIKTAVCADEAGLDPISFNQFSNIVHHRAIAEIQAACSFDEEERKVDLTNIDTKGTA